MKLQVAEHWYESLRCSDEVTLIRETHVHPDLRCNIWHVRGRDQDLLLDSGLGVVSLRDYMAGQIDRPVLAVASHTHFDHVGCHHEFEHRLCHPAEAHVLNNPDGDNTVWSAYRDQAGAKSQISALPFAGFRLENYRVEPAPASRLIDEGDVIDLGNRTFSVFHMPGHSPGSVCLFEAATATLFTGDVLYDGELLDSLYHSEPEIYLETLARLKEIPAEIFHCGHYASFGRERMKTLVDDYSERRQPFST